MLTEEQKARNREQSLIAEKNAKGVLKVGDRLRVSKCPGTKRWITFASWSGHWIVSKSGIDDFSPLCVDMLNGESIDFTKVQMLDAAAMDPCPEDGSLRDRSTNTDRDALRLMSHRKKLFDVSERYFAAELVTGVVQLKKKRD